MDVPTRLHKVTAFSQILTNLLANAGTMEAEIIKAASEDDLLLLPLNRYPLKLTEMPEIMAALVQELKKPLPDVRRIIEKVN